MAAPPSEALLDKVRRGMKGLRPPGPSDKVHKEECCYSYATPESPGGLFVNLATFQAAGAQFVSLDAQRSGATLYLHIASMRVALSQEEQEAARAAAVAAAAAGVGSYVLDAPKHRVDTTYSLAVLPGPEALIPLPCPALPELVLSVVAGVQRAQGAASVEAAAVWAEERRVSRYAEKLVQLDAGGKKISSNPADWRCDETGVRDNLWLNLSTGFIGSGRRNWDGSGGNGSALRHYEATGRRYPLAVKLGTITPHGADVYSYAADEDEMVLDPWLGDHLAHWGIAMMACTKSEKTMAELDQELNSRHEWSAITEAGKALVPLAGPGYVGLVNLGNSCYMASMLQCLWAIPELAARYVAAASALLTSAPPNDVASDVLAQMAKLGVALTTGATAEPPERQAAEADGQANAAASSQGNAADGSGVRQLAVRPAMFKGLLGRGHPEFSSGRQQDALEYFQFLLEQLGRAEHAGAASGRLAAEPPLPALFTFLLEDRLQCGESGAVSYTRSVANCLSLDIPLAAARNMEAVEAYKERAAKRQRLKEEQAAAYIGAGSSAGGGAEEGGGGGPAEVVMRGDGEEEPVIPCVPLDACLAKFAASEAMEDYASAALGGRKTAASKAVRLASFPPYLLLSLKRYYVAADWTARKLEVAVDVPDTLDLEGLRGRGLQPGEVPQPQEQPAAAAAAGPGASSAAATPQPAPEIVSELVSFGFSEAGAQRAALATGNAGVEPAMQWVLSHMEDPDFNDPLPPPAAAAPSAAQPAAGNPEAVSMLAAMGFTDAQAAGALAACSGNVERAADWLFSHMDDLDSAVAAALAAQQGGSAPGAAQAHAGPGGSTPAVLDGPGRYELMAIVSHMGSNTACGHYVAHIKKEGRWVLFNDEKVALSEKEPRERGYLYLFRRAAA